MNDRWKARLGNGFLVVLCVLLVGRTVRRLEPLWNWDVLGYMALALEWQLDDPVEVHRATYAAARAELPAQTFAELTDARVEVRRERFRDAAAFTEHIAFYRARVLPSFLMSAAHRLGAPLSMAVWGTSLFAFCGVALLIVLWLAGRVPPWAALVGGVLFAHMPPLLVTARFATADGLGTLLLCAGAYLFLERRRPRLGAALLTLTILTRPDAVLVIGAFAGALFLLERGRPAAERLSTGFLAVWVGASAIAYVSVQAHAGEYGWWPLFHISFLRKEVNPAGLPSAADWDAYRAVLAQKAGELPGGGYWGTPRLVTGSTFLFALLGLALVVVAQLRDRLGAPEHRRHVAFLGALVATYAARWFLFPQLWDRFLAPVYVLVPLVLVSLAARARATGQNASNDVTPAITSS